MPVGLQVPDFDLKILTCFIKIWSMPTSGQIPFILGSFLSGKFLTGGSSFLENTFSFPLSTVPSPQVVLNDQYRRPDAIFY